MLPMRKQLCTTPLCEDSLHLRWWLLPPCQRAAAGRMSCIDRAAVCRVVHQSPIGYHFSLLFKLWGALQMRVTSGSHSLHPRTTHGAQCEHLLLTFTHYFSGLLSSLLLLMYCSLMFHTALALFPTPQC